jgi:potassium channel subfamily K
VTILTVGFGDLYPLTNAGRAILIPYSVGGIITLGLVIQAIYKSVQELGEKNVVRHHFEQQRERTKGRTVRSSLEMQRREIEIELENERVMAKQAARPSARSTGIAKNYRSTLNRQNSLSSTGLGSNLSPVASRHSSMLKNKRIVLLKEEKERFEAMRDIQRKSKTWRLWYRLVVSLSVFGSLWCIGAVFFWAAEKGFTGQSYWETIYFCWVALLSIGYGDFAPKTGSGRCFFIIWSLLAVPSMTVLAGDLSSTVVGMFNHGSNALADLTVMPQEGMWRNLIDSRPYLFLYIPNWLEKRAKEADRKKAKLKRKDAGIDGSGEEKHVVDVKRSNSTQTEQDDEFAAGVKTADISDLIMQHDRDALRYPDAAALARQLALAIRRTAHDLMIEEPREYSYEEWAEFTRLIRFSAVGGPAEGLREEEDGMVEWDWIGEDSPMMVEGTETQFVLERLVESLVRYLRRNPPWRAFAETLKEKGEGALKLKGGSAPDEDGESAVLPLSSGDSVLSGDARSVRSWPSGGQASAAIGVLHPLHEHDDEHIHAGPHRSSQNRDFAMDRAKHATF